MVGRSVRMMERRSIEKERERRRGERAGDQKSGGLQVKDVIPYILYFVLLEPASLLHQLYLLISISISISMSLVQLVEFNRMISFPQTQINNPKGNVSYCLYTASPDHTSNWHQGAGVGQSGCCTPHSTPPGFISASIPLGTSKMRMRMDAKWNSEQEKREWLFSCTQFLVNPWIPPDARNPSRPGRSPDIISPSLRSSQHAIPSSQVPFIGKSNDFRWFLHFRAHSTELLIIWWARVTGGSCVPHIGPKPHNYRAYSHCSSNGPSAIATNTDLLALAHCRLIANHPEVKTSICISI